MSQYDCREAEDDFGGGCQHFRTGDRGQRYEVRFKDATTGEDRAIWPSAKDHYVVDRTSDDKRGLPS